MECCIESRKDKLRRKKPGALAPNEPKFIWIKMFNRTTNPSKELAVRSKFNTTLENILASKRHHYIVDVTNAMYKSDYFSQNNRITARGKNRFWVEVDQAIEDFDFQKRSLRPVAEVGKNQSTFKPSTGPVSTKQLRQVGVVTPNRAYKMPPPPPDSGLRKQNSHDKQDKGRRY